MAAKQEFLDALEDDEDTKFLELVEKHCSRSDPFDIDDVISSLDRKHLTEVWQKLQLKCNSALLSFNTEDDDEEQDLGNVSKILQGIIMVAMATIQMEKPIIIPEMLEATIVLHGILMHLPDTEVKLATAIARLCETWVKAELEGSANLADQTLQWLLYKTCEEKATQAIIKRVWGLREALLRIDLDQPSAAPLKAVLLATLISPNYLKLDEGRRFLAFLFTLKVSFVEEIHKTIKNQLPQSKKSLLSLYGEVYFRAWRSAEGATKEKIEHYCIQDLMYRAVHAPRGDAGSLASVLRVVMSYLHKQKIHPGVDQLLLRLYEPILWRSLKVANPHVRANAATLLVDVFPLRDPEGAAADVDNLLQRQIDALQTLLYDPNVTVRAAVVRGVGVIVSQYWEYLPNPTITWFINRLVADLAWDASSPEVRACVLQGMGRILDNHLSHPMLKVLLPELRNLLHDTSEVVRVAFLDLLLKIKGIRSIKFWTVAPMEHLLARLEGDSNTVMRRVVSLIFYSFMPADKPVDTQLGRCITLLQTNPRAARWFYRFAHDKMPLVNTVKFMVAICRCVLTCVRRERARQGDGDASHVEDEEADEEKEQEKENVGDSDDDSELSMSDTEVMAGLLETVVILWEGIKDRLQKPTNSDLKERLQMRVSQALPEFYRAFSEPRVVASLTLLAGFLPPNNIPTFSRTMLAKLRGLEEEAEEAVYSTMLESMCKWGKAADIIELIAEWFETTLVVNDEADTTLNKSRKKGGVQFVEAVVARPQLALRYTRYLMRSTVCQQVLLTHHQTHLAALARTLSNVTHCIEQRLQAPEPLGEELSDVFLQESFDLYCRLEILLHDRENKDHNAVTVMEHLVTWADAELLHCLRHRRHGKRRLLNQTDMTLLTDADNTLSATVMMSQTLNTTLSTTLGGSKRTAGEAHAPAVVQLATKLVKTLLGITSNMLLVGVADQELLSQLANFSESLLKTDESVVFLEQVAALLYQITELSATWDVGQREDDDEGVSSHSDVVPGMLNKMIHAVSTLTRNKKEQAERILPGIKSSVGQTLQAYYRNPVRPNDTAAPSHDVMATVMATMVAEMTDAVKKEPDFEKCDKVTSLPLLSNFLLSAIGRRKNINRLLVEQLHACVASGSTTELEGLLAVLHLVHTVSLRRTIQTQAASPLGELKLCLTAVQGQFETITLTDDLSEDSPYRSMHATTKQMLTDCMTRIGMVA